MSSLFDVINALQIFTAFAKENKFNLNAAPLMERQNEKSNGEGEFLQNENTRPKF